MAYLLGRASQGQMNGGRGMAVWPIQPSGQYHLPTLKKRDDMTNAGQVVNMHAVPRTAFLVVDSCLSSSIG